MCLSNGIMIRYISTKFSQTIHTLHETGCSLHKHLFIFICSPAATFLAFCVRFLTGISATAQHSAETERLQSTCPLHIDIKWKPT